MEAEPGDALQASLQEARSEIDRVDAQIIDLLAQRTRLVARIGRLKGRPERVRDPQREAEVLRKVRERAAERGIAPEFAEEIYQRFFHHFVAQQLADLERPKDPRPEDPPRAPGRTQGA